jgi:glyoxylase-like metal-dependent hydrolase (beta-lactamase superfamily II)
MIAVKTFQQGPVQAFRFQRVLAHKRLPLIPVHNYFLDGLMIDTNMARARPFLADLWDPLPLRQVMLTHYHEDHSGNAHWIQDRYQVPLYGGLQTLDRVAQGVPVKPYQRFLFGRPEKASLLPIAGELETEHYRIRIIPSPGHSSDHVCLYVAEEGWLFSGDLFLGERLRTFKKEEVFSQQLQSLATLLQLDFTWLFCAHNPRFSCGKEALQRRYDNLLNGAEMTKDLAQKGLSVRQIRKQLRLRENWFYRLLSQGDVSMRNMIESIVQTM